MPDTPYLQPCRSGCPRPATYLHLAHTPAATVISLRCDQHQLTPAPGLEAHCNPTGFVSAFRHVPGQSSLFEPPDNTGGS